MKKYLPVIPLVLLVCFVVGCQQEAEEPAVDIAAETEAVRAALMKMTNAVTELDLEGLVSCWADDVVSTVGQLDKEALRERYANIFAEGNIWTPTSVDKIIVSASGDLAYTIHSGESERMVEGETRTLTSSNLNVWKKQADGSWKVVTFK